MFDFTCFSVSLVTQISHFICNVKYSKNNPFSHCYDILFDILFYCDILSLFN